MIQSFNYSLFPNDEFLTFSLSVIAISEPRRAKIISIVPFLDRLITKNAMFEAASKRELKNPETPVKDQKSEDRKASYVAIRDFCGSASKRKNADINAAGKTLTDVFRKYGWDISSLGDKSRTSLIVKVLSELKTKYIKEVKLIGAEEVLAELEQAESEFELASKAALEYNSSNHVPTLLEARPELTGALKAFFQSVSLQQISATSDDVESLIADLNQLITDSLSTLKASDTRLANSKAKKKNDTTTTETTENTKVTEETK